jgi:hypothetical protein
MDLKELFGQVVDAPAPPSRLTADRVYDAARQRHRLAIAARSVGAAAAVLLSLGLVAMTVAQHGGNPGAVPTVADTASPPPWPGPVLWVGGRDARHLYATLGDCLPCPVRLVASEDGGRHWSTRRLPAVTHAGIAGAPFAIAPSGMLLYQPVFPPIAPDIGQPARDAFWNQHWISTDGARTWRQVTVRSTPVAALPAGGSIACLLNRWPQATPPQEPLRPGCTLYVIDPGTGTMAPLQDQPPADIQAVYQLPGGKLWVASQGGPDHRPALSVSGDGGRTWATHTFTDLPPDGSANTPLREAYPASRDGQQVYVVVDDGLKQALAVYRSDDAGAGWRRVDRSGTLHYAELLGVLVLPDGSHVVEVYQDPQQVALLASRDGGATYARLRPAGLPPEAAPVDPLADGGYVSSDRQAAYTSTDGHTWTRITVR